MTIHRRTAWLAAAVGLLVAAGGARAAAVSLAPGADAAALAAAGRAAAQTGAGGPAFSHPTLLAAQSFRVMRQGRVIGSLVSGQGMLPAHAADASPVQGCFVALVTPDGRASVVPTIGYGDWEAESCNAVAAVGLLPAEGEGARAGLIYKTSTLRETPVEPVVVTWSEGAGSDGAGLAIDASASQRASQAGADTLAKLRAVTK